MSMRRKYKPVANLLLQHREDGVSWPGLERDRPLTRKNANMFMLGSILDYQMDANTIWDTAERLTKDILGDPPQLWHEITKVSLSKWMSKRDVYKLHRFPQAHKRVWRIGKEIVRQYEGDARKIWANQSVNETLDRLLNMRVGPQISRMIVGALKDKRKISGKGDVKVDIHVRRVLGRVLHGDGFPLGDTETVTEITREMHPRDPWLLDGPLYMLGKQMCKAEQPECDSCYLAKHCLYYKNSRG